MPAGDVETYHHDGKWHNKIEGRADDLSVHDTKAAAVQKGREYAIYLSKLSPSASRKTVEHIVKNTDGQIEYRNTYPRTEDPPQSKG